MVTAARKPTASKSKAKPATSRAKPAAPAAALYQPNKPRPINDRVLIRTEAAANVTPGGIHLPEKVVQDEERKTSRGTVVAIGPGILNTNGTRIPMQIKVGDQVAFDKYVGSRVELEGESYLVLNEPEVLLVL